MFPQSAVLIWGVSLTQFFRTSVWWTSQFRSSEDHDSLSLCQADLCWQGRQTRQGCTHHLVPDGIYLQDEVVLASLTFNFERSNLLRETALGSDTSLLKRFNVSAKKFGFLLLHERLFRCRASGVSQNPGVVLLKKLGGGSETIWNHRREKQVLPLLRLGVFRDCWAARGIYSIPKHISLDCGSANALTEICGQQQDASSQEEPRSRS